MNLFLLFLLSLPWVLLTLYLRLFFRHPAPLPDPDSTAPDEEDGTSRGQSRVGDTGGTTLPFVSVIVPARNEEENIEACVRSLLGSDYPAFEIIVVDDRSEDGTGEIVRAMAQEPTDSGVENAGVTGGEGREGRGPAKRLKLISGDPLPPGWFGKPWACWQGAQEAKGDILLFTDADTRHGPDLLRRCVVVLAEEDAHALTLLGRQGMESFWEQLLQPQFFLLLVVRYPRVGVTKRPEQWKDAIANGQFIMVNREAYGGMGGHQALAGEVVEDLRFAQLLVRSGRKMVIRETPDLYTRMYRSLDGLVEGWSKNVATAALQTTVWWLAPIILPLSILISLVLWIAPPAGLVWALAAGTGGLLLPWALLTTSLSLYVWAGTSDKLKGNPLYGFLYPLGASVALYIVIKSWLKGSRIRWKGREYRMPKELRMGEGGPSPVTRNSRAGGTDEA